MNVLIGVDKRFPMWVEGQIETGTILSCLDKTPNCRTEVPTCKEVLRQWPQLYGTEPL
jgi:hypothetical protein